MGNPLPIKGKRLLTNEEVSGRKRRAAKNMILEQAGDTPVMRYLMQSVTLPTLLGALGIGLDDPKLLRRARLHKNNKGFYTNWTEEQPPPRTNKEKGTHDSCSKR